MKEEGRHFWIWQAGWMQTERVYTALTPGTYWKKDQRILLDQIRLREFFRRVWGEGSVVLPEGNLGPEQVCRIAARSQALAHNANKRNSIRAGDEATCTVWQYYCSSLR